MLKYQLQEVPSEAQMQAEIEQLLPQVSPQRREEALRYKHVFGQYACLRTYRMLQELLQTDEDLVFERNEHGKPHIISPTRLQPVHFNISHCRQALLVAVSDQPIGVDVEGERKVSDALLRYAMNEDEVRRIQTAANPQEEFLSLWTKKESLVKLRGTGLQGEIPHLLEHAEGVHLETHTYLTRHTTSAKPMARNIVWSSATPLS